LLVALAGVVGYRMAPAPSAAPAPPPSVSMTASAPPTLPRGPIARPTPHAPLTASERSSREVTTTVIPDQDLATARRLANALSNGRPVTAADLAAAEQLADRHADQPRLRDLLGNLLLTAGYQDQTAGRFDSAEARLRRAAGLQPDRIQPPLALASLFLATSSWAEAERAARAALSLDARSTDALRALAFALFRQDRNREARQVLEELLSLGDDPQARGLLARIDQTAAAEEGMRQQALAHFHVRYDGEAHEEVGREILRALERHYATLVRTFNHQPQTTIPVILFSRQAYFDATGAPTWSGGLYDHSDGRIRIPIGGLTSSLTPDIDQTLIHEVTHAFVGDISGLACPRDVNEGIAQYMEGKRTTEKERQALADGRVAGVHLLYLSGLSLVERLMAQRGQGGINELLRELGATQDVDTAFRRVYGQDFRATKQAWMGWLRQQYGS
jgi:tetratricopeptide (TPR) repeat protein